MRILPLVLTVFKPFSQEIPSAVVYSKKIIMDIYRLSLYKKLHPLLKELNGKAV